MRSFQFSAIAVAFLAAKTLGNPVALVPVRLTDLDVYSHLEERIPAITLGTYDLTTSKQNEVLFDLTASTGSGNAAEAVGLKVTCKDCRTWGSAIVSTTGADKDDDIIGSIINFFKDPAETIVEAFSVDLKLAFDKVGGHFEFDIVARDTVSYSIPIFQSLTPLGGAISDDVSIGLVLSVELVFSVTAQVDLTAGFDFSFPEDTFITVDPLTGEIKEDGFTEGDVDPIPVTVTSGSATFKAALKVKLQAGTTVDLFGTGFDFELGVFANVIEYVATISTTDACEVLITELLDVNIGAFAQNVIKINFLTLNGSPPIVTTLLTVPLPSLCITRPVDAASTVIPTITAGSPAAILSTPFAAVTPAASTNSSLGGIFVEKSDTPITITTTSSLAAGTTIPVFTLNDTVAEPTPIFTASVGTTILYPNGTATKPYPTHTASVGTTIPFTNGTITASAPLITSTVYTTNLITLTKCASAVINCPASLAHEIIITSTSILYTTICPAGATLPPYTPTPTPKPVPTPTPAIQEIKLVSSVTVSKIHLVPCPTPIVETIYTPTFQHPTYIMPTATVFTKAHIKWNTTAYVTPAALAAGNEKLGGGAIITDAAYSPLPSGSVGGNASAVTSPSAVFTGAASRSGVASRLLVVLGFGVVVLL